MTVTEPSANTEKHPSFLRKLVSEPLLHFLLIGTFLFAFYQFGAERAPVQGDDVIVISQSDIARLSERFASTWMRNPDEKELKFLIDEFLREEVYYRESLAMGLDRNDAVIRQRLRQKLEFLTDQSARGPAPTDAELQAHYQEIVANLTTEAQISFDQVFLGEADDATAAQALAALQAGADASEIGRMTLLPAGMQETAKSSVDNSFGTGFFASVVALPVGQWAGPVESAFGVHLVRVIDVKQALTPPLEQVRDTVEQDWRRVKAKELQEQQFQAFLSRYRVTIERAAAQ